MTFSSARPYLAAGSALIGLVAMALPWAPLRVAGVMLFVTFGPGLAVIRWFGAGDYRDFVLVVSFSLALHLVLAVAMTYAQLWAPHALLGVVASGVLLLAWLDISQARRSQASGPAEAAAAAEERAPAPGEATE